MPRPPASSLTAHELSIMQIFWQEPGLTVKEVLERLDRDPQPAYTSLLTTIRLMEKKKYLTRKKDGKAHRYHPNISQNDYQQGEWGRLVDVMFGGDPVNAAVGLLKAEDLNPEDLDRLRSALEDLK